SLISCGGPAAAADRAASARPAPVIDTAGGTALTDTLHRALFSKDEVAKQVRLSLPGGATAAIRRVAFTPRGNGRSVWQGRTDAGDAAAFATRGGVLTGFIIAPDGGVVRVRGRLGGALRVTVENPTGEPFCGLCGDGAHGALHAARELPSVEVPLDKFLVPGLDESSVSSKSAASRAAVSGTFSIGCDIGQDISILVAYTEAARAAAGSVSAIEAEIDLAIANTNQAYADSGVDTFLNLVGTIETPYDETTDGGSSLSNMLNDLRDNPGGVLDGVLTTRDLLAADLVALAIDGTFGSTLGRAGVPGEFSVNRWDRLSPFVFAHETGHNRGCGHEQADAGANREFPFAAAHFFSAGGQERSTLMNSSITSRTLLRFSNPAVQFSGVPTGVAGVADNALAMNTSDVVTASLRCNIETCADAYQIGPRSPSASIGFPTDNLVWMNQHTVEPGAEEIVQISVTFGADGADAMVALWDDPNGDGFPDDAVLIAAFGPVPTSSFDVTHVRIPATLVGAPGDSFFVGAASTNATQVDGILPAHVGSIASGRSFQLPNTTVDTVPAAFQISDLGVNYAVVALGASTAVDCNGNGSPDACDIAEGAELDANGNNVPDSCEATGCSIVDIAQPFNVLNSLDLIATITAANSGDLGFDVADPAGGVDIFDVLELIDVFNEGCP
ncbi:MAG: M12 family metallo-peptidase, partial [Planctomycetota bacterium]